MIFVHKTLPSFWHRFNELPEDVRHRAEKQFALLAEDPGHPSIQLKPVGEFWSARVTDNYRALAVRESNTFNWFWIGLHGEYERLLKG